VNWGFTASAVDAANVFKSVLARGEVRIVGATTLSEYKEFIQEDEALARRFRTVHVAEPTIEQTRTILYNLRPRLERNYSVRIKDDAIETALEMSPRYMRHLQLPDKVISWLDTAAVRAEIAKRWEVTGADVVNVISKVARIPEDMVFREVSDRFRGIEDKLANRVVGQREAIRAVARRLVLNKGPLKDGFDRPDGVLLFLGPMLVMRGVALDSVQSGELRRRLIEAATSLPFVETAARSVTVPFWSSITQDLYVAGIDSVDRLGDFFLDLR
jgi:ATP-dependent Clp protease ATP-binding subunit ClpA